MKKYSIYKNKDQYIISTCKFQDIKEEIKDFEYAGYFEVDANEICEIYIDRIPFKEIIPLAYKLLEIDITEEPYVCINRYQLIFECEED